MHCVYDADEYQYITVIVRPDKETRQAEGKGFELFFDTDTEIDGVSDGYTDQKQAKTVKYSSSTGFQVMGYDMSAHTSWTGKINMLRLDYYTGTNNGDGDYCDIAAIILSRTPDYAYEAAYEFVKKIYTPVQVLKDFPQGSATHFGRGSTATKVSVSNGNILYSSAPKDGEKYDNPYSAFWYKEYMESVGRKSEILTTDKFSYTVIKFRTNDKIPDSNTGMQLFVYTNEEKAPEKETQEGTTNLYLSPSCEYTVTTNYAWRTTVFNMDCEKLADNPLTGEANDPVSRWTYTNNFNGFRVDWCSNGAEGAFLEMDEIMFFKSGEDAVAFSNAVNQMTLPSTYGDREDTGDKLLTSSETGEYVEYDAYSIDEFLQCSNGVTGEVVPSVDGWSSIVLSADSGVENPYALLKMGNFKMDAYPNLTFVMKKSGFSAGALALYYKTAGMDDYDNKHRVKIEYKETDSWQVISFDMRDMPNLIEDVTEIKLEFLSGVESFESGAGVEIYSFVTSPDNESALEYVKKEFMSLYCPVQIITDFGGGDEAYFVGNGSVGATYNIDDHSITLTVTEDASVPYADILYNRFMYDSQKYMGVSAEEFKALAIKVNGQISSGAELVPLGYDLGPIGKSGCHKTSGQTLIFDMLDGGANENDWFGEIGGFRFTLAGEGKAGDSVDIIDIYMFATVDDAERYFDGVDSFAPVLGIPEDDEIPEETLPEIDEETETRPVFDDTEDTTDTEDPGIEDTTEDEESKSETTSPEGDSSDESSDEETTADETSSEDTTEEESTEEESEESETDDNNIDPLPDIPSDFDPNGGAGDGGTQRAEGSKTPFVVACVSLGGLSGASIISVVVIKLRLRVIV
jgi:hypothetical protein